MSIKTREISQAQPASPLEGLRIVFVLDHFDFDGPVCQSLMLARHLQAVHRAEVHIWALRPRAPVVTETALALQPPGPAVPGRGADECQALGLPWKLVPGQVWESRQGHRLLSLTRLTGELRRLRPHVILPYVTTTCLACGLAWRFTGADLCIWNQGDEGVGLQGNWPLKWLAIHATPLYVSNSDHAADLLIHRFGAKAARMHIVRNGIDLPAAKMDRAAMRRELGIDTNAFVACMVANITARKDHATLIRAWRLVVDSTPNTQPKPKLLLAGRMDNPYPQLKQLSEELGILDEVIFLGSVRDVSSLLGAADLGVHSSWLEGCPIGAQECMASGLAVVGTDIAGIREAVGPGSEALLAPVRDAEALAECIIAQMRDPEQRQRIGKINRNRVAELFSSDAMCRQMVRLITGGLGRVRRRARAE